MVCGMILYCYSFLLGFKCIFQLYSSGFSQSKYGYRYHVTLCSGQLHPIAVYKTVFLVVRCSSFECHYTRLGILLLSSSGYANAQCATPWMFLPQDILLEYWIEHVTFGLLYVMFTFPTMIFYRGIPGLAIDCPCGVWYLCLMHVGPRFGNLI